jgi:hypothetical protein
MSFSLNGYSRSPIYENGALAPKEEFATWASGMQSRFSKSSLASRVGNAYAIHANETFRRSSGSVRQAELVDPGATERNE